jgi:hypothetical protein
MPPKKQAPKGPAPKGPSFDEIIQSGKPLSPSPAPARPAKTTLFLTRFRSSKEAE